MSLILQFATPELLTAGPVALFRIPGFVSALREWVAAGGDFDAFGQGPWLKNVLNYHVKGAPFHSHKAENSVQAGNETYVTHASNMSETVTSQRVSIIHKYRDEARQAGEKVKAAKATKLKAAAEAAAAAAAPKSAIDMNDDDDGENNDDDDDDDDVQRDVREGVKATKGGKRKAVAAAAAPDSTSDSSDGAGSSPSSAREEGDARAEMEAAVEAFLKAKKKVAAGADIVDGSSTNSARWKHKCLGLVVLVKQRASQVALTKVAWLSSFVAATNVGKKSRYRTCGCAHES